MIFGRMVIAQNKQRDKSHNPRPWRCHYPATIAFLPLDPYYSDPITPPLEISEPRTLEPNTTPLAFPSKDLLKFFCPLKPTSRQTLPSLAESPDSVSLLLGACR